jgi:hypothetical protein
LDKEELNKFFSFAPEEAGDDSTPMFPVNNKNALDKFRGGRWNFLDFDGLAQLCERFPYIIYPVLHVQYLFRSKLLGVRFWERLDRQRMKVNLQERSFVAEDGKVLERPGRCTMKEILEYSRRKTIVQNGRRVGRPAKTESSIMSSDITKLRDEQISRMPLMNLIRNCRCMYYVPNKPPEDFRSMQNKSRFGFETRPELELPSFDEQAGAGFGQGDVEVANPNAPMPWDAREDDSDEWETDTSPSDDENIQSRELVATDVRSRELVLGNPIGNTQGRGLAIADPVAMREMCPDGCFEGHVSGSGYNLLQQLAAAKPGTARSN